MASKRMFDRAIVDTDKFMDMPLSSKAVYFLLGMEADDEGFVSYKKVMRVHGGNEDDLKVLVAKGFVLVFPSGVVVITDWNKNNYLDANRLKPTEYQNEKKQLLLTEDNKYEFNKCLTSIEESSIEEKSGVDAEASLSKKGVTTYEEWRDANCELTTKYGGEEVGEVEAWKHPSRKTPYSDAELRKLYRRLASPVVPKKAPRTRDSFDFDTWLDSLRNSSQKADKIVALIWKEKGYRFENYEQWRAQMGQDSKYVKDLVGYSGAQISAAIDRCRKESEKGGYDWKASTVAKKIAEITI